MLFLQNGLLYWSILLLSHCCDVSMEYFHVKPYGSVSFLTDCLFYLTEKFKTGMTKEYAEKCLSITSAELLDLLKSHDHDAVVEVADRTQVIGKRELRALLDRSHLVQKWQGMFTSHVSTYVHESCLNLCASHFNLLIKPGSVGRVVLSLAA